MAAQYFRDQFPILVWLGHTVITDIPYKHPNCSDLVPQHIISCSKLGVGPLGFFSVCDSKSRLPPFWWCQFNIWLPKSQLQDYYPILYMEKAERFLQIVFDHLLVSGNPSSLASVLMLNHQITLPTKITHIKRFLFPGSWQVLDISSSHFMYQTKSPSSINVFFF